MRTEDDIRAVFVTMLERHALDKDAVRARLRATDNGGGRASRGPGPVRLVVVAVLTAAVAVAVPLTVGQGDDPAVPEVAAGTGMWRELPFVLELPRGWKDTARTITADWMENEIAGPSSNGEAVCSVTAYRIGRFDMRRIPADREPVTVKGRPGFYAEISFDVPKGGVQGRWPAVAWEYAPGAWAISSCPSARPAEERALVQRMAAAATFTARPFPVPFKLGYLPDGFEPATALAPERGLLTPQMSSRGATVELAKDGLRCDSSTVRPVGDQVYSRCVVSLVAAGLPKNGKAPVKAATQVTPVTIDGHDGWFYSDRETEILVVDLPQIQARGNGYYLAFMLPAAVPDARDQLRRIAEQTEVAAAVGDQSTWFDASSALP